MTGETTERIPAMRCEGCAAEIPLGVLACPSCARLTFGPELAQIASAARAAESAGDRTAALAAWRRALALLPEGTVQRGIIDGRMRALSAALDGRVTAETPRPTRDAKRAKGAKAAAGGLGAVGVALLKFKTLVAAFLVNGKLLLVGLLKLPTLLSMIAFTRFSPQAMGGAAPFALGIVASLYVHEVGHVAALRRYGIEASAPMFVPGVGAFVRMKQYPTDAHEEARVGLAGPVWGLGAAVVAALAGRAFGAPVALGVASLGATINLFNLVPVWHLDGARALKALSRGERLAVAAVAGLTAIVLRQWMPAAVALGCAVQALGVFGAAAGPGDRRMLVHFAGLVVALGALAALSGAP